MKWSKRKRNANPQNNPAIYQNIRQRRIQNPVKHLKWSVLRKYLTAKTR